MAYSIFETPSDNGLMAKAFATAIQSSTYHWHKEYEMLGVLEGELTLCLNTGNIVLKKGDLYFLNPGVVHCLMHESMEENLVMVLQLKPELFREKEDEERTVHFYLDSTDELESKELVKKFFRQMAEIIFDTMSEEPNAIFLARAHIYTFVSDLFHEVIYDEHYSGQTSDEDMNLTRQIIKYLELHLSEGDVLDACCLAFGFARKTMDRIMKKTVGKTTKDVLEQLRVEQAKLLLKNSSYNMNLILDTCGFGSEKTFYRVFRQNTGYTPKEFREKGQTGVSSAEIQGYLDSPEIQVKNALYRVIHQMEETDESKAGR